jgi:glycosyltransferase involved in cell wall biosynthesis
VCRLLAGLQRRGHDVRFFVARDAVAERARAFALTTELLHVGGDAALHHGLRVARVLRRHRADVLIVGTFRKLLHLAAGARAAGVPLVARIGLEGDEPRNAKYRFLFRHWVDRIVVSTASMRRAYLAALPELGGRVVHIPKGIAPLEPTTSGAAFRAEMGVSPDAVVVTALARLVPDKRIERFVDVVSALPGVVGLVAGDGPMRQELEAHARACAAPVRFLGHVERVADLLAATDLLLVTSRRESMSNATLEAMGAGVPVVSTPVDGADEVLADEGEGAPPGVVTASFEVDAIAAAALPLVRDAGLRASMGASASRRARARYGEDAMLDGWERLLREVAAVRVARRS